MLDQSNADRTSASKLNLSDWIFSVPTVGVKKIKGGSELFDIFKVKKSLDIAAKGLEGYSSELTLKELVKNLFENIKTTDIAELLTLSTAVFIQKKILCMIKLLQICNWQNFTKKFWVFQPMNLIWKSIIKIVLRIVLDLVLLQGR